jgi:hypothetical protein
MDKIFLEKVVIRHMKRFLGRVFKTMIFQAG